MEEKPSTHDRAAYMRWYRKHNKEKQQVVSRYYTANREECITRATVWQDQNPQRVRDVRRQRYHTNSEVKERAVYRAKQYYVQNSAHARQNAKLWRERNGIRRQLYERMRKQGLLGAIPAWFETDKIRDVYTQCRQLNRKFSRKGPDRFEADHIIPLVSDTVCGLHCWSNLQLLCKSENAAKSNRYQQEW